MRILEVASLDEIARALGDALHHVLHFSAHGSPGTVELEDEDRGAVEITTEDLVNGLRDEDLRVPLIVLSSCSGAADAPAVAANLVRQCRPGRRDAGGRRRRLHHDPDRPALPGAGALPGTAGADRGLVDRFSGTASAAHRFPGAVRDVGAGAGAGRADRAPPAAARGHLDTPPDGPGARGARLDRRSGAPRHERAFAMRIRRINDGRAAYPHLVGVPRHLAALGRAEEVPSITDQVVGMLAGALAASAYLAEVRQLLPTGDVSWVRLTKQEYGAIRSGGNLDVAAAVVGAVHRIVTGRVATDPDDEQWAGDLSIVLVDLGDLAVQPGDLRTARGWFELALPAVEEWTRRRPDDRWWKTRPALIAERLGDLAVTANTHFCADLAIAERLATADPTNTTWQRDLSIAEHLANLDPANAVWRDDLARVRARLVELGDAGADPGP